MEGRETYRYATRTLAASALAAIERAGWTPDQVDLFIPHQANIRIIEAVAKGLGLPMDRMVVNIDRYGNTSAASVAIALDEAVRDGRIRPGHRLVLFAFGAGFTSGAAAITWTAEPADSERSQGVRPVASVRAPLDWDSVDPMPARLSAVLESPGGPPVPLDDVVPGEPEPAPAAPSMVEGER
jgi:3-hydroxy-3-methylglutaryl CoA synthase